MASKKFASIQGRIIEIQRELQALGQFRSTKAARAFKRQLVGELAYLQRQAQLGEKTQKSEEERWQGQNKANQKRSAKNKRNWRYWRSIATTYGIPIRKVRSEFKKHREGLQSEIDVMIWRNPSP